MFSDLLFLASLCANSEVWVRDEDPASYASDWLILTNRLISLVGLISVVSEGSGFDSGCVSFQGWFVDLVVSPARFGNLPNPYLISNTMVAFFCTRFFIYYYFFIAKFLSQLIQSSLAVSRVFNILNILVYCKVFCSIFFDFAVYFSFFQFRTFSLFS